MRAYPRRVQIKTCLICVLFSTGSLQATADEVAATATARWDIVSGADWNMNTANNGLATLTVIGTFTHPGGGVLTDDITVGDINKSLGNDDSTGTFVLDSDGSGARAAGSLAIFNIDTGIVRFTYSYTLESTATGVPGHDALSKAIMNDPIPLTIGSAGPGVIHQQILRAGSRVQRRLPGGYAPALILRARFGQGAFDDGGGGPSPEMFWRQPRPSGAIDLYSITLRESAGGAIEATVTHFASSNPDYALAFPTTAATVKALIESAGWVVGTDGNWMLPTDLALSEVTISATTSSNAGADAAIGVQTSLEAADGSPAIPVVSDVGLMIIAAGIVAIAAWRLGRLPQ
ncbi:MAG: hypothetical protein JNG88_00090 [Phycisphaerales bacterium]|nr:hypothetical protein [Phycisphaerales bacterium]